MWSVIEISYLGKVLCIFLTNLNYNDESRQMIYADWSNSIINYPVGLYTPRSSINQSLLEYIYYM